MPAHRKPVTELSDATLERRAREGDLDAITEKLVRERRVELARRALALERVVDAFDLLGHPLRMRLIWLLGEGTLNGRTVTPREASEVLDATLGTISYHVRTLHDHGLLALVRTTQVRGAIAHHYALSKSGRTAFEALERIAADFAPASEQ